MICHTYSEFRSVFAPGVVTVDAAGYETWPLARLRAGGFAKPVLPEALIAFPLDFTINDSALDGDDPDAPYSWYLSQRTDDPAKQMLSIIDYPGQSGTITIDGTALLNDTYTGGGLGPEAILQVFANVWIYVVRAGDNAIQCASFLERWESDV